MSGTSFRARKFRPSWGLHAGASALLLALLAVAASPDHVYVFRDVRVLSGGEPPTDGRDLRQVENRLRSLAPRGIYVVVDTHSNRLYVKRGETTLLQALCSTGSGELLRDPETSRQWIFDTPRGVFRVLRKVRDPVWTKPDWAFIEEGQDVPAKWSERRDPDTLGDYALHFGDGYMIHGTLYQRYIGRPITHGCIRLGDEDLQRVFELVPVGAEILIF